MATLFKCACGITHAEFGKTQRVIINNNEWDLDCYLSKIHAEYRQSQIEAMLSQLTLSKIKADYPNIDVEGYAKKVAEELNANFSKEPTK